MEKEYRIKKNEEIATIVQGRKKVYSKHFNFYYEESEKFRVAISVSKKYGGAVERNYAKRILRELIRPNLELGYMFKIVVVVKNDVSKTPFDELLIEVSDSLKQIDKKIKDMPKKA